jgi:hypothetical protein
MLWYVVDAITKDNAKRVVSFSDYDTAVEYSNAYMVENPNSYWVGVVDQDDWYSCYA